MLSGSQDNKTQSGHTHINFSKISCSVNVNDLQDFLTNQQAKVEVEC